MLNGIPSTVQAGFERYSLLLATAAQTAEPKLEDSASYRTPRSTIALHDGRSFGVVRQGPALRRRSLYDRLRRGRSTS